MLAFTQHPYMLLSSKALPLWIALLSPRDNAAKQESQPPNPSHSLLPLECVSALLDLAGMVHLDNIAAGHADGSLALLYTSEQAMVLISAHAHMAEVCISHSSLHGAACELKRLPVARLLCNVMYSQCARSQLWQKRLKQPVPPVMCRGAAKKRCGAQHRPL